MRSPFTTGFTDTAADQLAVALKAVADPHRLKILALLNANGELTIVQLVAALGSISQPTVSHHVRKLWHAGLVHKREAGVFVYVRLDARAVADIASALSPWSGA